MRSKVTLVRYVRGWDFGDWTDWSHKGGPGVWVGKKGCRANRGGKEQNTGLANESKRYH